MKKIIIASIFFSILASIFTCVAILYNQNDTKQAYIEALSLFNNFEGTKELEAKLLSKKANHKVALDSLKLLVVDRESELYYQQQLMKYEHIEGEMEMKYNTQIWNQLNSYINDYGQQEGYDFIYGATGSGSMMYAKENLDITDEVIKFANEKYEGK